MKTDPSMLLNYIKVALRNILRSKAYSVINILGLSLGIACCLLLYLYVADEFTYDKHHARLNDIYRIDTRFSGGFGSEPQGSCSPPIAMALKDEVPEIEAAVRILNPPGVALNLVKYGDALFYEPNGFIADSTLFDVLGFQLVEGNPRKALSDANTVIISATMAKKVFGNEPALDKSIFISQGGPSINYKITGVFRDDLHSVLSPHFVTSMMSEGWGAYIRTDKDAATEWAGQNFVPSYVKLVPGHSKEAVEKKMNDVLIRRGGAAMKAMGMKKTLLLEPLKDIYLRSITDRTQRITWIYVIASLGIFILLIACINFMNLSTAKSARRSTEIGIRKVMGAFRSSLAAQILGEAMVMVVISILISIVLVQLSLPFFNQLSGKTLSIAGSNIFYFTGMLVALVIVTGLIAGSYPALYLSSFQPATVLKGKFNAGNASGALRQSLVVFQFAIAIILGCGMIIISQQLSFVKNKDLGFDSASKIVLPLRTDNARKAYEPLKKELLRNSSVAQVSGGDYVPGSDVYSDMSFYTKGQTMESATNLKRNHVDAGYLELLGIKLVAGRSFTDNRQSESQGKLIINEKAAEKYGKTPEEMIGQPLYFDWQGVKYNFEVVGVMSNINQTSLHEAIKPYVLEMSNNAENYEYMLLSTPPGRFKETIALVEKVWKSQVVDTPFEYTFLDEKIQRQYSDDEKVSTLITTFTGIAIFICCLGLYGLSSFMAERRFKEIGVRKVMGANVPQIVGMMSKEFVRLIIIAFVIAAPIAWYVVTTWLKNFEYKVSVSLWVFITAGAGALIIALITISYESFRAAGTNPVHALRNE